MEVEVRPSRGKVQETPTPTAIVTQALVEQLAKTVPRLVNNACKYVGVHRLVIEKSHDNILAYLVHWA